MTPTTAEEEDKAGPSTSAENEESQRGTAENSQSDSPSIGDIMQLSLKDLVSATMSLNSYPQGASRDLYCSYPAFGRIVDIQSDRMLKMISKVIKMNNIKGNIDRRPPDEQLELLSECMDTIMERLNSNLDKMAGIKKNSMPFVVGSVPDSNPKEESTKAGSWNMNRTPIIRPNLTSNKNLERPQFKFQTPVDNSSESPFVPKLKEKPNSLKPLAILPEYDEEGKIASYLHPYEYELMKFEVPESQLNERVPQEVKELREDNLLYVDSSEKLNECLEDLRSCKEVAIDVEHHSYRSFLGITCLVQLSTRDKDYLIDTLVLRDEVHILNEIFTNPKVIKVFHGADMDVEWLQRDLALYIVNMFDTHQAARALSLPRLSLSYLLKHYCSLEVDKSFQLADWRIRPLPEEFIKYARQDTHYLLYIFDCITNDLLKAGNGKPNILKSIYLKSTELCKKRYRKPVIDEEAHLDLFRKSRRIFDNRQLSAMKDIYHWRDSVARAEDESYGYVLPNHMLLQISESLPREMQGILACCNPIPPLVRQHLLTIHQIILKAREQPLVKPILENEPVSRVSQVKISDYHNVLYCPHDNSHLEEFRDDLPTLLNFNEKQDETINDENQAPTDNINKTPDVDMFNIMSDYEKSSDIQQKINNERFTQTLPYLRYLTMLPKVELEKKLEFEKLKRELARRQLCPAAPTADIKQETDIKNEDDDDMYKLPIKQMLKRKHDKSDKNTSIADVKPEPDEQQNAKRFKTETPSEDKLKFVNLPPTKKEKRKLNTETQDDLPTTSKNATKTQKLNNTPNDGNKSSDVISISSDSDSDVPQEVPIDKHDIIYDRFKSNLKNQPNPKNKNRKKFKNKQKFQHAQSSNKPIHLLQPKASSQQQDPTPSNFDYNKVDFKRFQGGAKRAKGPELKGKFQAKSNSNKSQNKKFNKLFTFSNVKNNKK